MCCSSPCQDTDINQEHVSPPSLPSFDAIAEPTFVWSVLDGRQCSHQDFAIGGHTKVTK